MIQHAVEATDRFIPSQAPSAEFCLASRIGPALTRLGGMLQSHSSLGIPSAAGAGLSLTSTDHQSRAIRTLNERDLADGWGRVQLPTALARKYPKAPADWRWQWVFPQATRGLNPRARHEG